MKPLSLEVDSKDTKRVNLPIGRVLVPELVAVVNSPILIQKKKMVDSALNEMAEKALDDMLKEIDMNKKSVVQFIADEIAHQTNLFNEVYLIYFLLFDSR